MSDYPILVRRYTGTEALTIICEACGEEEVIGADDLLNEGLYACSECGGSAIHKYDAADACPNCGKLGYYEQTLDGCCSRVCQLQAEYKESLAA